MQERVTTKQRKKIFGRNSSLVTQTHNILMDNPLRCDELLFQLVTPTAEKPEGDESGRQLITP